MRTRVIYDDFVADIGLSRLVPTPLLPMAAAHRMQTANLVSCFSHHRQKSCQPPRVHSGNSMMVMVERWGRSPRGRAGDWGGRRVDVAKPVTTLKD